MRCVSFLFAFFALLGWALYEPKSPDLPQTWLAMGGAFSLFLAWVCSAFSLGHLVWAALKLKADAYFSLVLGLGLFSSAAILLGLAGQIGYFPNVGLTLFLVLPPIFISLLPLPEGWKFSWPNLGPIEAVGFFFFILFFFQSWIPDSMPDPLWYHLTAARWWLNAGAITFPPSLPFFHSGQWDALNIWGGFLVGSSGEGGLIAQQLFGQWTHFILGGGLTLVGLIRWYRWVFPLLSSRLILFLTLASFFSASQLSTLTLAKNDWGAGAFLLASFALWAEDGGRDKRKLLLSGFFLGLAFASKMTVSFIAISLAALMIWEGGLKKIIAILPFIFGGFLAGGGAFFLRNFMASGNPIFPAARALIGGDLLGPSWQKIVAYEGSGYSVKGKFFLLEQILRDSPFLILSFLAVLLVWKFSSGLRRETRFLYLVGAALLFFFLKVGVRAEIRLFGLGCLLVSGMGLGWVLSFFTQSGFALNRQWLRAMPFCSAVLLLALAGWWGFPYGAPHRAISQPSPPLAIREHFGGTAQTWIRLTLPIGAKIASANETRLFYLSGRGVYRIWDNAALDAELYQARSLKGVLDALKKGGVEYLLFSRMDWDVNFRPEILDLFERAMSRFPQTVAFRNENSAVIDLAALEKEWAKIE